METIDDIKFMKMAIKIPLIAKKMAKSKNYDAAMAAIEMANLMKKI